MTIGLNKVGVVHPIEEIIQFQMKLNDKKKTNYE